jgi:hypothetical protein
MRLKTVFYLTAGEGTKMPHVIDRFMGQYAWLSNFYPCNVVYQNSNYKSIEHAYQASKTLDIEIKRQFQLDITAGQAKNRGRRIELRADWDSVKIPIMRELVVYKFALTPTFRDKLLATGYATLIEGNTWGDRYWGVFKGEGHNHLGKLIMQVRSELRQL